MAKCRGCGKEIRWIETKAGKRMPCDLRGVPYWKQMDGKSRIVTPNGEVVACKLDGDPQKATGIGFIPHWATCTQRQKFKKAEDTAQGSLF